MTALLAKSGARQNGSLEAMAKRTGAVATEIGGDVFLDSGADPGGGFLIVEGVERQHQDALGGLGGGGEKED